jgi:hypothetical protein
VIWASAQSAIPCAKEFPMEFIRPAVPLLLLAACVPFEPLVSDFNGSSVKIVDYSDGQTPENTAEAERICKKGSKKTAEYASTVFNQNTYQSEHLFLCL